MRQPEHDLSESRREPGADETGPPTGDRADKHAQTAEPHQTPVPGDEAELAAKRALSDSSLTHDEVRDQASYRGNETDVGQQAATAQRADEKDADARSDQGQ
jgi:hypothetical protein